ncbi:MAG: hypothetical protein KKF39_06580 [Nanoarchaeota archaeon]|nr:hypothetical protein [Nanoarchaeota archaeon]
MLKSEVTESTRQPIETFTSTRDLKEKYKDGDRITHYDGRIGTVSGDINPLDPYVKVIVDVKEGRW